ncbi:MAG: hypothetical protein WBA17_08455 [Saprospiraceae bacterium]
MKIFFLCFVLVSFVCNLSGQVLRIDSPCYAINLPEVCFEESFNLADYVYEATQLKSFWEVGSEGKVLINTYRVDKIFKGKYVSDTITVTADREKLITILIEIQPDDYSSSSMILEEPGSNKILFLTESLDKRNYF